MSRRGKPQFKSNRPCTNCTSLYDSFGNQDLGLQHLFKKIRLLRFRVRLWEPSLGILQSIHLSIYLSIYLYLYLYLCLYLCLYLYLYLYLQLQLYLFLYLYIYIYVATQVIYQSIRLSAHAYSTVRLFNAVSGDTQAYMQKSKQTDIHTYLHA